MTKLGSPARRRPGLPVLEAPRRLALALLALFLSLSLPARAARGDVCSDCAPPSDAVLAAQPGFVLETREGFFGPKRDYVEIDGGECSVSIVGDFDIEKKSSYLVLRGAGTAWNCPHSKACDTVTASISAADIKEWSLTTGASIGGSVLGVSLSAQFSTRVGQKAEIRVTTTVSKLICPTYCHVIDWSAFFEVATYEADVDYEVTRRWAWWTKNVYTGGDVHHMGEVFTSCGTGTATFQCQEPILGYFHLLDRGCDGTECGYIAPQDLRWFPPLPDGLPIPDDDPIGGGSSSSSGSTGSAGAATSDDPQPPDAGSPDPDDGGDAAPDPAPDEPKSDGSDGGDPDASADPPPPEPDGDAPSAGDDADAGAPPPPAPDAGS